MLDYLDEDGDLRDEHYICGNCYHFSQKCYAGKVTNFCSVIQKEIAVHFDERACENHFEFGRILD